MLSINYIKKNYPLLRQPQDSAETLCQYFAMRYFHPPCLTNLAVYPKHLTADGGLIARRYLQYGNDGSRLPTEGNIRHLTTENDGAPQKVVISTTRPGFEPCTSWTVWSFYLHSNILFIQRKFIIYFRSLIIQFTVPSSVGQYQVQTHIASAKSCEMHSLVTAVSTATASDAEGKMQRCQTCDLGSESKLLRSPTNDVTCRKKFLVRCTPNPSFTL
jgi:hypothetical protein